MASIPARSRSTSQSTTASTPAPSRRRLPFTLSPLKTGAETPKSNFSSTVSVAPSVKSTATITTLASGSRFGRGHTRNKRNLFSRTVSQNTVDPDTFDLTSLEDPDEVFRLFTVKEVRALEKRASDAAASKVSELRTMVGERYRDLLLAADSIVRMSDSANNLSTNLENVEYTLQNLKITDDSSSKKSQASSAKDDKASRSFDNAPSLSFAIHLLISIPSLVHSQLDAGKLLQATRLSSLAQTVYQELVDYSRQDDKSRLLEGFPIIEAQAGNAQGLQPFIESRAFAELGGYDVPILATARTLASLVMLKQVDLSEGLLLLLNERSNALNAVLEGTHHHEKLGHTMSYEMEDILRSLKESLNIILSTKNAAKELFISPTGTDSLLLVLLKEIQSPSLSPTASTTSEDYRLTPTLSIIPNYAFLARHLPHSIISRAPHLPALDSVTSFSQQTATDSIDKWVQLSGDVIVSKVKAWVQSLGNGAQGLSTIRSTLESTIGTSERGLQERLLAVLQDRLKEIYKHHLTKLVERVKPCLSGVLEQLPASGGADLVMEKFWFQTPLNFPPASLVSSIAHTSKQRDPFEPFVEKVMKRVEGKSPLLEKGIMELKGHAKSLHLDLKDWISGADKQLLGDYLDTVALTLDKIADALTETLDSLRSENASSVFFGNLVFILSKSRTFEQDLALGHNTVELFAKWHSRLESLLTNSLAIWATESVATAVQQYQLGMELIAIKQDKPSIALLNALECLVEAVKRVGPFRVHADPSIPKKLLYSFRENLITALGEQKTQSWAMWDFCLIDILLGVDDNNKWISLVHDTEISLESQGLFEQEALVQLQKIQLILYPLLPMRSPSVLLPFGAPPSQENKAILGMVPGPRLGLLPTR